MRGDSDVERACWNRSTDEVGSEVSILKQRSPLSPYTGAIALKIEIRNQVSN